MRVHFLSVVFRSVNTQRLFTKKLLLPPTRPLNRLCQHPNPVPPSPTSRNTSSAGSGNNASSAAKSLSSTAIPISANPLSPSISPPASPPANPCPRHHPAYCVPVELSQEREFEVEIQA